MNVFFLPDSKSDEMLDGSTEKEAVVPSDIILPASTTWGSPVQLTLRQRAILEGDEWLEDDTIDASQEILQKQFEADGLQSCVVGQLGFQPVFGPSVQIHFDEDRYHWFTSCFRDGKILIADSMNRTLSHAGERQLVELYHSVAHDPLKVVTFLKVARQPNTNDCGLYAVANAFELLDGNGDPTCKYDNRKMRAHLALCLERGFFSPFPRKSSEKASCAG